MVGRLQLSRQQSATEHDAWFRAKVQEALDGIKDGSNPLIDESEWKKFSDRKRADLKRLIAAQDPL